ncbi:hypothetical protein B0H10DRAFT_2051511 [Mycena sp. CBHHK59/15]|nr:hypothetical protein B0H10DRAFT_2051511 [Mycena sp. CBHHK59/15]
MEMSLDDIIAARPKTERRTNSNRGKARAQVLGNQGLSPATRARAKAATPAVKAAAPTSTPAEKIIVSNLPPTSTKPKSRFVELFHTTVGPLREVTLHYDATGRSKGVATVLFSKKGDGNRAYQQYNNRLIDGRRPMKIEIVVDPARPTPPATLASRVAPAPAAATTATVRTGTATRGRGGKRGRGGRPKSERTPKTAADLDAEMEDYTASNAPAAA